MSDTRFINAYPIFRTLLLDSTDFTKFYLLNSVTIGLDEDLGDYIVKPKTPLERYMAKKSGLGKPCKACTAKELADLCIANNGMPGVSMSDEDALVCKKIFGIHMNNTEKNKYEFIRELIRKTHSRYNFMCAIMCKYDGKEDPEVSEKDMKILAEAKASGWFEMNEEYKNLIEKSKSKTNEEEEDDEEYVSDEEKELPIFSSFIDHMKEAINLIKNSSEDDDDEDDDEDDEDTENTESRYNKSEKKPEPKKEGKSKAKDEKKSEKKDNHPVISLESLKDNIGYVVSVEDGAAGAAMPMVDMLMDDISDETREQITNAVIDVGLGLFKTYCIGNMDKFTNAIKDIPSEVAIDASVDGINGLRDIIEMVLKAISDMKKLKSDDISGFINIVNDLTGKLKANIKVFTSKKFMTLVKDIMNYKPKEEVKVVNEPVPAAMNTMAVNTPPSPIVLPASLQDNDDSVPSFCKEGLNPVNPIKSQKDKPDFIVQTNNLVIPSGNGLTKPAQIECQINTTVKENFPWVEDLAATAAKNGVSVIITPITNNVINVDGNSEVAITAIQVAAYVNGNFNNMKSFTIDLGFVIDTRIKTFFNASETGWNYLEKCEEAYVVFIDNKNKVLATEFFDKVFAGGKIGINDDDNKKYRIINSNLCQLNRVIEAITIPSNMPKPERKILKDTAFKMMTQIKEIGRLNKINLGRFRVQDFDKKTMSYKLSNIGTHLYGIMNTAPRCLFDVAVDYDDNKAKLDKDGRACATYTISFIDNVFDIDQMTFPNNTTRIDVTEKDNDNIVEVIDIDTAETPAIIAQ